MFKSMADNCDESSLAVQFRNKSRAFIQSLISDADKAKAGEPIGGIRLSEPRQPAALFPAAPICDVQVFDLTRFFVADGSRNANS